MHGIELHASTFGILPGRRHAYIGCIKPGDIPSLEGKKYRVTAHSHSDVQCATRSAVFNGGNEQRVRLRGKTRGAALVEVVEHDPPRSRSCAMETHDDAQLPTCFCGRSTVGNEAGPVLIEKYAG